MRRFRLFPALLGLVLIVPLALALFGYKGNCANKENRKLHTTLKLKGIPYKKWPKQVDSWFNDSLPFRSKTIERYIKIWDKYLSASTGGKYHGLGREFFSNFESSAEIRWFLGLNPIPFAKLRDIKYAIAGTQAYCQTQGITYMCFYIPDKTTIYSDRISNLFSTYSVLPFTRKKGESWRDQLLGVLKDNKQLNFYDLYPIFKEESKKARVYHYKYDTSHWNARGLMLCYEFIREKIGEEKPNLISQTKSTNIELKTKILEKEEVVRIEYPHTDVLQLKNKRIPDFWGNQPDRKADWQNPDYCVNTEIGKGRLLLSSDSYMKMCLVDTKITQAHSVFFPLVNDFHEYLHCHYQTMTPQTIRQICETYRPDIYIEAFVEHMTKFFTSRKDTYFQTLADLLLQTSSAVVLASGETNPASLPMENATWSREGDTLIFNSQGAESYIKNSITPPPQGQKQHNC